MNTNSLRKVITRVWRGQYGLAKSWWLFGILGTALLNAISGPLYAFFTTASMDGIGGVALLIAVIIVAAVGAVYGVVVTVGIVRSALAYKGNQVWSNLAIILAGAAWLFALGYVAL